MKWNLFFLGIVSVFLLVSCEDEKDKSTLLFSLEGSHFAQKVKAGEKVLFPVKAFSTEGHIIEFHCSSYDPVRGLTVLKDSVMNVERLEYLYQYVVPEFSGVTEVKLIFQVTDSRNSKARIIRYLRVDGGDISLTERSAVTLYGAFAVGKPDAYNLLKTELLYSGTVEADSLLDICAYRDKTTDSTILNREWRSFSGMRFVRFNDFNYSEATRLKVETAFLSGNKFNYIRDICADDVIIVGDQYDNAKGVVKIIAVFDEEGAMNDRYIFNIKLIR